MGTSRDHYVARTYLKHFQNENKKLWVYGKPHLDVRELPLGSVCWRDNWSSNPFFKNDRVIEEYLKFFENNWSKAVGAVSMGNLPFHEYQEQKSILAGYIAYLKLFPPGAVRAGQNVLEKTVKAELKILKHKGLLPPPPKGYEFLLEDLDNQIKIEVDEKYPHAVGLSVLVDCTQRLFDSPWTIIHNDTEAGFITSDNPACNWFASRSQIGMTYVPLSPKLAVLIMPPIPNSGRKNIPESDRIADASLQFVVKMNILMTKSADKNVIANVRSDNILKMVKEYHDWAHGSLVSELKTPSGTVLVSKWGPFQRKSSPIV